MAKVSGEFIEVVGARQNNLKGFNLKLPLGELIVVTGVSGSGKSSLAFDTIYAAGPPGYTFSPYAQHQRMLIGQGARKIRTIGSFARKELEVTMNQQVYLDLNVLIDTSGWTG